MGKQAASGLNRILAEDEAAILAEWIQSQVGAPGFRSDRTTRGDVSEESRRFLGLLRDAVTTGEQDINGQPWAAVRRMLDELSYARAQMGFSPSDTAAFILSLKQPIFERLARAAGHESQQAAAAMWESGALLDRLALYTTEVFQKGREQVIVRQQQELMELSTPVVTLWDGVLALPVIGTLDSARTQIVMESLLQRIVDTGASIAIIDITGVPTVDTLTAQHLLKTVAAARLMGADCIISGIRPQIAQTIVHLGVELGSVLTKATLADAFAVAMRRLGLRVVSAAPPRRRASDADQQFASTDDAAGS